MRPRTLLATLLATAAAVAAVTCHGGWDGNPDGAHCDASIDCAEDLVCFYPDGADEGICRSWCETDGSCWADWLVCVPYPDSTGVCVPGEGPHPDGDADVDGDTDTDTDTDVDGDADGAPDAEVEPGLCTVRTPVRDLGAAPPGIGPPGLVAETDAEGNVEYGLSWIETTEGGGAIQFLRVSHAGELLAGPNRVTLEATANAPSNVAVASTGTVGSGWAVAWETVSSVRVFVGADSMWTPVTLDALSEGFSRNDPSLTFDGSDLLVAFETREDGPATSEATVTFVNPVSANANSFLDLNSPSEASVNERAVVAHAPPGTDEGPFLAVWQARSDAGWTVYLSPFAESRPGNESALLPDTGLSSVEPMPTITAVDGAAELRAALAWREESSSRSGIVFDLATDQAIDGLPMVLSSGDVSTLSGPVIVDIGTDPGGNRAFAVAWGAPGSGGGRVVHLARVRIVGTGAFLVGVEELTPGDDPALVWGGDLYGLAWREAGQYRFARFHCDWPGTP